MVLLETIKKWLQKILGLELPTITAHLLEMTKDGTLLAQILQSYGVIDHKDLQLLQETTDPLKAYENFTYHIKEWMSRIGIDLTDHDIYDITHGDGTSALTIFYDVYTRLDHPHRNFSNPFGQSTHVFKVEKVSEYTLDDIQFSSNPLCEPLLKQWDVISWERDHLQALISKYSKSRKEYEQYLEAKLSVDQELHKSIAEMNDSVFLKTEETHYTYSELIEQQKKALEMEEFVPNMEEAKKIMKNIKRKNKKRSEKAAFSVRSQQDAVAKALKIFEETEEVEFEKLVCEKLLKESQHEKEIAEKLFNIRRHKETIINNRKIQDEIEQKNRDEEFIRKLFEEELEERLKYHQEKMAVVEEHKRLYAEKMRLKALKHEKLAEEAVKDVIDVALKAVEYKQMYGVEPNKYIMRNWKTLFVQQQPIFDLVVPAQSLKESSHEEIPEEIYHREMKRQDVLDMQDLDDYIHFEQFWIIEEGFDELKLLMELGMNVLGYIVHRILLRKYPLPVPEKPNLPADIEIAVCTSNVVDLNRLGYLQRLLAIKDIKVIQMEDAINYCVQAFETEHKTEFDEPFPDDDENLKQLTPTKNRDQKKGKGGKKDKKGKKDKGKKKDKKDKKNKKGKTKDAPEEPVEPVVEEKQAQTPRLFPWEKIILSNKARLGKIAKTEMEMGNSVDDKILVEMFIEYLLSLTNIKGWVLINYPNTYEQAVLLEQALTGRPVPKEYADLNKESLESLEIEESKTSTETTEESSSSKEHETKFRSAEIIHSDEIKENFEELSSDTQLKKSSESLGQKNTGQIAIEKISKLLPDLKNLAYSSDENDEETEVISEAKGPPCACICNPEKSREFTVEKSYTNNTLVEEDVKTNTSSSVTKFMINKQLEKAATQEEDQETLEAVQQKQVLILLEERDDPRMSVRYPEIVQTYTEYEVSTVDNAPREDCTCYVKDVQTQEVSEQKVIDSSEAKIEVVEEEEEEVNDNPRERPVAVDINEEKRLSKIVTNPRPVEKEMYLTLLTAFIKILPKEEDLEEEYQVPIFKEIENKDSLAKFYCDQGCFYLLEYEEFNSETIKCLAKMIIGDYSLPLKSSVELFGERYKEAIFEVDDIKITKKGKEGKKGKKKDKKKSKDKGSKTSQGKGKKGKDKKSADKKSKASSKKGKKGKDKKSKGSSKGKKGKGEVEEKKEITYDDKEVQVPFEEEPEELPPEPKAGEPDWQYIDLPIPVDVEVSLATCWENFEENYIKNLKEQFFNNRVLMNDIVPFLTETKGSLMEFIARPDSKGLYLHEFQKTLNEIDLNLRDDQETKTELYCRIEEFKEKLLGICDTKMRESEDQRREVIRQNWLFHQFCEMTNNTIITFQIELDRFVDTLQILSDYYIAIITKSIEQGYQFEKETVPKHNCNEELSEDFNTIFLNMDNEDYNTQYHEYIKEICQIALVFVESMRPHTVQLLGEMKKIFEPQAKQKQKPWKKKKGEAKKFEPDEDVKENIDAIFEEWECALNGEFARMIIVLNVLKNEACKRFDEVLQWIRGVFKEIYDSISVRYENELSSVHKACELLTQSVEDAVIIQPELTFEDDQLAMIQVTLFPDSLRAPVENYKDGSFKLEQIEFMVDVLLDLARGGFIMKKTFLLLIQDMLYQDDEEEETDTPKLWRNLSTNALSALFQKLFLEEDYFYWKDFIVCNLMIPFPSREDLLDIRTQFRNFDNDSTETVSREDFDNVIFWFEDLEDVNVELLKSILFKMYRTEEDVFNYTAMLLDFCKDEESVTGFVKALELSLGRFICYDQQMGEDFVKQVLEDRFLYELKKKEHEECLELAKKFINRLLDKIIVEEDDIEELTITELFASKDQLRRSLGAIKSDGGMDSKKLLVDNKFSHSKLGFESREHTEWAFFLPLELVIIVISNAIGWSSMSEVEEGETFVDKVMNIYEKCKNEKFNDIVLSHEFLNCDELKELFNSTSKFSAHNPVKLIKQILYDKQETVEETRSSLLSISEDLSRQSEQGDNETLDNL